MVASVSPVKIRLTSGPYVKRIGLITLSIALLVSWSFSTLWLATSFWLWSYNWRWATLLGLSTLLFSIVLAFMTYRLMHDAFCDYVFELTDDEAVLSIKDRTKKRKSIQMVLLDDVNYAEYYPWRDMEALILHAPYADMEVPLWPFQGHGQDVVDFLSGHGVRIINAQMDDRI